MFLKAPAMIAGAFVVLVGLLSACASSPRLDPRGYVKQSAAQSRFAGHVVQTPTYALQTFFRGSEAFAPPILYVYVEGDGRAWISRSRPSRDPTPLSPVAFELARIHAAAKPDVDILYIARPCQYVVGDDRRNCGRQAWTHGRFSESVVDAIDRTINRFKTTRRYVELVLVGFSGGGTVATLLAARRNDVRRLVTVAGVLDHAAWTKHHGVSPLTTSLNPHDQFEKWRRIPRVHIFGEDDDVVPARLFDAQAKTASNPTSTVSIIPGADHGCCWEEVWPQLLARFRL